MVATQVGPHGIKTQLHTKLAGKPRSLISTPSKRNLRLDLAYYASNSVLNSKYRLDPQRSPI